MSPRRTQPLVARGKPATSTPLLQLRGVRAGYGGIEALHDIDGPGTQSRT